MFAAFNFVQGTPSATWTINHGLGVKPVVDVTVDGQKMYPMSVEHITDNQLVLTFSVPRAGKARLVGNGVYKMSPTNTYFESGPNPWLTEEE